MRTATASIVLFFLTLLLPEVQSEQPTLQDPKLKYLQQTATEIRKKKKDVPESVLQADLRVILPTIPKITETYKKREAKKEDIEFVVSASWIELRVGGRPNGPKPLATHEKLIPEQFIRQAEKRGKLRIGSKPDEANVKVNGIKCQQTNTTVWVTEGRQRVQLSKEGYQDIDELSKEVKEGQTTDFWEDLKPKK